MPQVDIDNFAREVETLRSDFFSSYLARQPKRNLQSNLLYAIHVPDHSYRKLHHPNIVMFLGAVVQGLFMLFPVLLTKIFSSPFYDGNRVYVFRKFGECFRLFKYWDCLITFSQADVLQNQAIEISWVERVDIAKQAAKGMNYLHTFNPPIIHRDLKSLNILVDNGFCTKIADLGCFGIAKCSHDNVE